MRRTSRLEAIVVKFTLCCLFIAGVSAHASAQDIVYNWANKKLETSPPRVNQTRTFNVVLQDINDILYTYRIIHTSEPIATDDLSKILDRLSRSLPSGNAPLAAVCAPLATAQTATKEITDALYAAEHLPFKLRTKSPPVESYSLAQSLAAWNPIYEKIQRVRNTDVSTCSALEQREFATLLVDLNRVAEPIEKRAKSTHQFIDTVTLSPGNKEIFEVVELFEGQPTKEKGRKFEFTTTNNILTLSGGILFSKVPNRSYVARKTPDSTQNVLVVEGTSSFRPEGVALLNYMIPGADWEQGGFALSAGPVVRFGATGDTSSLGFFTGISGNLFHRLYVTPGLHFGQFADFPADFYDRRPIPANFGELTPIKRWTGRFAVAVSFQTLSFGGQGGGDQAKVKETKPATTASRGRKNIKPLDGQGSNSGDEVASAETRLAFIKAAVRSVATPEGATVTLYADAPLQGHTTYRDNNIFYIVIPNSKVNVKLGEAHGEGFKSADVQRTKNGDVVITFVLHPGTTARVEEKFNRLNVIFATPGKSRPTVEQRPLEAARKE